MAKRITDSKKGGVEFGKSRRNIMGTLSFEFKLPNMRKMQEFIVYPAKSGDMSIMIQSGTRIGQINMSNGVGVMSQSHANGAYGVHLATDQLVPFRLTDEQLTALKENLAKTAGTLVGSSVVKSDNSGADKFKDGGQFNKVKMSKYLELKTADGKYWVGNNINPYNFILIKARMHGISDDNVTFVVEKSELDKIPNSANWNVEDKAQAFIEVKDDFSDYEYAYVGVVTEPVKVMDYVKGFNHSVYKITPIPAKEQYSTAVGKYSFVINGHSNEYAEGGQPRGLKGKNLSDKIENNQKFKRLINETFNRQSSEHKYPEEFIRATALTEKPIVKHNGSLYLKGYLYSGTITNFEFMDLASFKEALELVDRPTPQNFKFEDGGSVGVGGTMDTSMDNDPMIGGTMDTSMEDAPMIGGTMDSSMYAKGGGIQSLKDEIKDLQEEIEYISNDKSFTKSFKEKYVSELIKEIEHKKEKIRTFYHSEDTYAKGGAIHYTSDGKLRMKKVFDTIDTYLPFAKVGDVVWFGYNISDFDYASKSHLWKVQNVMPTEIIVSRFGRKGNFTLSANSYDQKLIVVGGNEYAKGGEIDSEGSVVVDVYKGHKIYDKGASPKAKYRFYARGTKVYPPYNQAPIVANAMSVERIKQYIDQDPSEYAKGGEVLNDDMHAENYKAMVIKTSDSYESGDGFNSRFIGATNKKGDVANGEYIIENNRLFWTYTDNQGREYTSEESPIIRLHFAKGGQLKTNKRTLDRIANIHFDIYDVVGAESGSQLREDKDMLGKYAKLLDDKVSKIIAKKSLTEKDFEYYEDNNYHLLNEFLSWNDYFATEEYKDMYKRLISQYDSRNFADPEYIVVETAITAPTVASKTSSTDKPNYKAHAQIKTVKVITKNGKTKTVSGDLVLNGAHYFKKGGSIKADYEYFPKARVVEVVLMDGSKIKPLNGYWISKKAKFARGGGIKPFEYTENGAKIYVNGLKADVKAMYLDYVNNFLTVGGFADYYGISDEQAQKIIESGREYLKEDGHYAKGGHLDNENAESLFEIVVVSTELEKDGGRILKDRFAITANSLEEAKEIAKEIWNESFRESDLGIVAVLSDTEYREKYLKPKFAEGGEVNDVMSFEEFKKTLPILHDIFVLEKNVEYKPRYDKYSGTLKYFKHGRRNLKGVSLTEAYRHYEYFALQGKYAKGGSVDHSDHMNLEGASEMADKKYELGGEVEQETPKVWIGEWSLYNEGKLIGEWLDLSEFEDGEEVMQAIQALLDKWTAETGELREEYAVFDYENFPQSMYSEQMGETAFDNVISAWKFSQEKDVPMDVVATIVQEYSPSDLAEFFEEKYVGQFDTDTDLAYDYVEQMGGVANLGKNTLEMYFDYESFGRSLAMNDYREFDGHYFRVYANGGMLEKDLSSYMKSSHEFANGGKVKSVRKQDYELYLNELGTPSSDHPDNGGRVSRKMLDKYGTWLRKNDPIAFEVGFNEFRHQ